MIDPNKLGIINQMDKEQIVSDVFLRWLLANFSYALNYQMAEEIAANAKKIYTFFGAKQDDAARV